MSSCPAIGATENHGHCREAAQTPEASEAQQTKEATDQASFRTRLSSNAKMFQPKPLAMPLATSTTYYSIPTRPYVLPSQHPACPEWSRPVQPAPILSDWSCGPRESPCLLSTPSTPTSTPKVILGSSALPSIGSGGHATGECKPCAFFHRKGCSSGKTCLFCHLCDADAKRKRHRQRGLAEHGHCHVEQSA